MVPGEEILRKAREVGADIIGVSGLITPSLEEMAHIAEAMEKKNFSCPLLIGGATTSAVHTAVKIAPRYSGTVVHVPDASRAVGVVRTLLDTNRCDTYGAQIRDEQEKTRVRRDTERRSRRLLPLAEARRCRLVTDWENYRPPRPSFIGVRKAQNCTIDELRPYIDWRFFLREWDIRDPYPAVLDHEEKGAAVRSLIDDANRMLDRFVSDGLPLLRGMAGLYPANSTPEDDILVYQDESRTTVRVVFPMLRRQFEKRDATPSLSLADYIAPVSSGGADYIGCFVVTAGLEADKLVRRFEEENDSYSAAMTKILTDRLAEAFAERLHQIVRTEWWGYAPDEALSIDELLRVKYRGIRPAPGYPPCPDHGDKALILDLLSGARDYTGVFLTESNMMVPEASVCGLFFSHPQSRYFSVGKIADDQLIDYARRKGLPREEVAQRLAAIVE